MRGWRRGCDRSLQVRCALHSDAPRASRLEPRKRVAFRVRPLRTDCSCYWIALHSRAHNHSHSETLPSLCSSSPPFPFAASFCSEVNSFKVFGVEYNSTTDMLAYVGYAADLDAVVITFRGTRPTSILDWLEDLNFFQQPAICDGCLLHEGFLAAYYSVREATVGFVRDAVALFPQSKIIITGHSLGGALSYLASVDLALNEGIKADMSDDKKKNSDVAAAAAVRR